MEFEIFTHPQLIYMAWTCLKRQRTQERERERDGGRKIEREGLIYRRAGTVYDSVTRVLWVCPSIPLNGPIYFTYRPKYSNSWAAMPDVLRTGIFSLSLQCYAWR